MAYHAQGIRIIDNTKRLNIANLISGGYVKPGSKVSGTIIWDERFKMSCEIGIHGLNNDQAGKGYILLIFSIDGQPHQQELDIISRISNLDNKSFIYYFRCKASNKIARKLYFNGREFVHQSYLDGLYRCQTLSRKERDMNKLLDNLIGPNDIYNKLSKKHLKKTYRGKLTRKYAKLLKWKNIVDKIGADEMERLFITGSF